MKTTMFLSDFLLLKTNMDYKLLDSAVDAYDQMKKETSMGNHSIRTKIKFNLALNELIKSVDTKDLYYETDQDFENACFEVVKMIWDTFMGRTGYIIKKVSSGPKSTT